MAKESEGNREETERERVRERDGDGERALADASGPVCPWPGCSLVCQALRCTSLARSARAEPGVTHSQFRVMYIQRVSSQSPNRK